MHDEYVSTIWKWEMSVIRSILAQLGFTNCPIRFTIYEHNPTIYIDPLIIL